MKSATRNVFVGIMATSESNNLKIISKLYKIAILREFLEAWCGKYQILEAKQALKANNDTSFFIKNRYASPQDVQNKLSRRMSDIEELFQNATFMTFIVNLIQLFTCWIRPIKSILRTISKQFAPFLPWSYL